jgi:hypothetical protein
MRGDITLATICNFLQICVGGFYTSQRLCGRRKNYFLDSKCKYLLGMGFAKYRIAFLVWVVYLCFIKNRNTISIKELYKDL